MPSGFKELSRPSEISLTMHFFIRMRRHPQGYMVIVKKLRQVLWSQSPTVNVKKSQQDCKVQN